MTNRSTLTAEDTMIWLRLMNNDVPRGFIDLGIQRTKAKIAMSMHAYDQSAAQHSANQDYTTCQVIEKEKARLKAELLTIRLHGYWNRHHKL
jgi:hypothetical protein